MGCGASVAEDDGGWGKSDSEVRDGVFTGSTPARASRRGPTHSPHARPRPTRVPPRAAAMACSHDVPRH